MATDNVMEFPICLFEVMAEDFPLSKRRKGGGIVALDEVLQPKPSRAAFAEVDELALSGLFKWELDHRAVGQRHLPPHPVGVVGEVGAQRQRHAGDHCFAAQIQQAPGILARTDPPAPGSFGRCVLWLRSTSIAPQSGGAPPPVRNRARPSQ